MPASGARCPGARCATDPNADLSRTTLEPLALRYGLRGTQGRVMERKRLDKKPEAETALPHLRRASSMPVSTSPPTQGPHAQEGISDSSPRRDREHSAWTGAGLAMYLPTRMRDVLKRYGLALALASLALLIRHALPVPEGTAIYQLPLGGGGPERLVRRTRTRLVRFADLRNGNSVLVHPTGEFIRAVAGLCVGLLHLRRSLPAAQPSSVRDAGVPRTRSA